MTKRAAPDGGYDFGPKRDYRRHIWGALGEVSGDVAMMPSIEGDEIWEAEKRGFSRPRIHVVDRNPAIVAHIQRRFPGVRTYGVDLLRAQDRMAEKGVSLAAANWDLCGPIGPSVWGAMQGSLGLMVPGGMVGVTVLRGRETRTARDALKWAPFGGWWSRRVWNAWTSGERWLSDTDVSRLWSLAVAMKGHAHLERAGIYRSTAGSQTMLWSVWRCYPANYWMGEADRLAAAYVEAVERCKDGVRSQGGAVRWISNELVSHADRVNARFESASAKYFSHRRRLFAVQALAGVSK